MFCFSHSVLIVKCESAFICIFTAVGVSEEQRDDQHPGQAGPQPAAGGPHVGGGARRGGGAGGRGRDGRHGGRRGPELRRGRAALLQQGGCRGGAEGGAQAG